MTYMICDLNSTALKEAIKDADFNVSQVSRRSGRGTSSLNHAISRGSIERDFLEDVCKVIGRVASEFIIEKPVEPVVPADLETVMPMTLKTFSPEITRGDIHDLTLAILNLTESINEMSKHTSMLKKNTYRIVQNLEGDDFEKNNRERREYWDENHSGKKA